MSIISYLFLRRWCEAQKQDLEERLQHMTNHFEFVSKEMKSKINKFAEQVEHQVCPHRPISDVVIL